MNDRTGDSSRFVARLASGSGVVALLSVTFATVITSCGPGDARPPVESDPTVWSGPDPDFGTGDVSPGGEYFSDIDWDDGRLQLVDLASGAVTKPSQHGYGTGRYAWRSAFSTDGRRLALSMFVYEVAAHELRVLDVDTGDDRILVPAGDEHYYVEPLAWSPDDREIAVALQQMEGPWQLGVVSVDDGSLRIVSTLGWQTPGGRHPQAYPHAEWSPDGAHIAFDYPRDSMAWSRDIFVVDPAGGGHSPLYSGEGSDHLLGWMGNEVVFYSDRSGDPAVWRVGVEGGRANGDPMLVRRGVPGLEPLAVVRGRLYYGRQTGAERVMVATVELASSTVVSAPEAVDSVAHRRNMGAAWSPSGDRLAFIAFGSLPHPEETLVIVAPGGETLRSAPLPIDFHAKVGTVSWVDDSTVLLNGSVGTRAGIFMLDISTMEMSRLSLSDDTGGLQWYQPSPNGSELYATDSREGRSAIVAHDVRTGGTRTVVASPANPQSLAVSPAGDEIAYLTRPEGSEAFEIHAVGIASGEERVIFRSPSGGLFPPLAWSSTGHILSGGTDDDGRRRGIRVVPPGGGASSWLPLTCCPRNSLRVSPDGRSIATLSEGGGGAIHVMSIR